MLFTADYVPKGWRRTLTVMLRRRGGARARPGCSVCHAPSAIDLCHVRGWGECNWCNLVVHIGCLRERGWLCDDCDGDFL